MLVNKLYNYILMKKNNVKIIGKIKINGKIFISGKNIIFGDNVKINSGCKYNPIGGQERMIMVTNGSGKITIGNNVGVSNSTIVSRKSIIIDDNVMIGGSCKIYDTDFHSIGFKNRMRKPDINVCSKEIHIKNGAFIGAHSIILKGVTIGEHAVIGAGSVVTKNIPKNEIWAGNPAKFIRKIEKEEL